ncbi:MAG: PAS domain S-box protein [Methanocalculus sp.]|nr:PAS domain S-box protein [Methanocalculus sp.]MDG6251112.1 PAS domain S-box protein [Methanocalculus sp.]
MSYNDVIHPDYRDCLHEQWSQTLANHGILVLEYPILTKGGQIKWVWEKGSGVYSESGEVVALEGFITDITERRTAEQIIRESESRLRYLLGFYERAHLPEKELLAYALEGACVITGSQLGYLAFLNDDESELSMYAWSETAMKECSMQEKPIVYAVEKTGLWGEAVRQRCPVITNDYAAVGTEKKGYPEGHPQLIRHMNVPILDGDQIVIVAGVANNPLDYTDNDTRQLTLLMQGLWQVLKRRRIEEEFQSQQEQLTEITEMIPGVVFQFYSQSDGEKGLYYISSRADEVFGISSSPEGFLSRFTEQVDPRDRDSFLESIEDATKAGLPWNYEGRFIRPSGEEIWFQGMSRPIQRGNELLFNGILLDITDRKDAENALNERIKELSCLYRISDAIEGSGRPYAEVMQAIAEIIPGGFQHPEITAASIRIDEEEYSTSDYQLKPWSKQTEIFVHKEPVGSITICLMEDNQILDEEEILISTIADQIGQYIERIRTVARLHQANEQLTASEEEIRNRLDEIVTAQKQLALSEERYQAIFEHTNAASLIIEKDTVISLCNSAFEKLCGYSKDEVIGRSWTEFVSDTDREQMIAYHRQRRETGEDPPQRYEFTFIDRGDASHSTLVTVGMIPGTSQSVASIYDITDRKEAEVALSQAHKKLRILSSITSHDVANKIMTIRGLLEIALDREDKQYTGICHDEIRKATDAIERQIVFMREYEQIGIQESSWMELAPLISRIDDRQLPVQNTCPEISFYADPMVEKVFQNLYVNTILHAQTATRIVISCEEREGDLAIIWEDDGPGIPDDQKEEIFVRGFGKNTGFGLFLAREILAITRITIQETGTYGKGARFEIIVPEGAWQKGR